eukprot:4833997-Pleurochrysis_carterae.AAC.1
MHRVTVSRQAMLARLVASDVRPRRRSILGSDRQELDDFSPAMVETQMKRLPDESVTQPDEGQTAARGEQRELHITTVLRSGSPVGGEDGCRIGTKAAGHGVRRVDHAVHAGSS